MHATVLTCQIKRVQISCSPDALKIFVIYFLKQTTQQGRHRKTFIRTESLNVNYMGLDYNEVGLLEKAIFSGGVSALPKRA